MFHVDLDKLKGKLAACPSGIGYFDKVAVRARRTLTVAQRKAFAANADSFDDRDGRPLRNKPKHSRLITIVAPNDHALAWIDDQTACGAWFGNYAEIALDFAVPLDLAYQLHDIFNDYAVQRWHGRARNAEFCGTTYTGPRHARRMFIGYVAQHSKVTNDPSFHWEARLRGAAKFRQLGPLSSFDHRDYWQQNLRLFIVDLERL